MPIHVFRATDAGAPTLNGSAGSGITLLDAVLVNGYNTKTVTLARSGSTVTASETAHGFVLDQVVAISGADQTEYNGLHKVTSAAADTFTFELDTEPATPATGTISCKVAPLGWTKPYTGTNIAVYRQPTGTSNGFYLRVDDSTGNGMRVRGYESMSDASAGTGPFPTTAQQADPGLYWWKSASANSTARTWTIYSDGKFVNFIVSLNATSTSDYTSSYVVPWHFGDITTYFPGDAYATVIGGSLNANANNAASNICSYAYQVITGSGGSYYIAREYTGTGTALTTIRLINSALSASGASGTVIGSSGIVFPNQTDGKLYHSKVLYSNAITMVRGEMPGVLAPLHSSPFDHGTRFEIGGDFYICQNLRAVSGTGCVFIKVTGEW